MGSGEAAQRSLQPEDLGRLFLERANDGDVDGSWSCMKPQAALAFPPGPPGHRQASDPGGVRRASGRPCFPGTIRPPTFHQPAGSRICAATSP